MEWQHWLNDWFVGDAGAKGAGRRCAAGPEELSKAELFLATGHFGAEGRLGGRFGVVHRASLRDGSQAAVKVINSDAASGANPPAGLASELAALTQLRHPCLAQLQGWGHGKGQIFLVYELLDGGDAAQWLHHSSVHSGSEPLRFGWSERLWLASDAASGLQHMHSQAVFHRAIRCSNVLLHPSGVAKIGDFSLQSVKRQDRQDAEEALAVLAGLPLVHNGLSDARLADAQAFGVVLLELLMNTRPARRSQDGSVTYPIFEIVQPLDEAAERRAAAAADAAANWPPQLALAQGRLGLSAVARATGGGGADLQEVADKLRDWTDQLCDGCRSHAWCGNGPGSEPLAAPLAAPQQRPVASSKPGAATEPGLPPVASGFVEAAAAPAVVPAPVSPKPPMQPPVPTEERGGAAPSAFSLVCIEAWGRSVSQLPMSVRTLYVDAHTQLLGRKHQRGFFETLLGHTEGKRFVACVSRSHLKVDAASRPGMIKVTNLSINPVVVAGGRIDQGRSAAVKEGEVLDFIAAGSADDAEGSTNFPEAVVYLRFRVEQGERRDSHDHGASGFGGCEVDDDDEAEEDELPGVRGPFWLMLSGTAVKEELEISRRRVKSEADGLVVGRAHQTMLFNDAIARDVVQYVSREHFRIDRDPAKGTWRLLSTSPNPIWHVRSGERSEMSRDSRPIPLADGDSVLFFTGATDKTPDGPNSQGSLRLIFRASADVGPSAAGA